MSKRALVVDLDMLESCRDLFREMAKSSIDSQHLQEQAALVDHIIRYGTTVDVLEPGRGPGPVRSGGVA